MNKVGSKRHLPEAQMSSQRPARRREQLMSTLQRADRISRLMDESFTIPIIRVKLGWDALIGLVPFVGDLLGALISVTFVWQAWRIQAPIGLLIRMSLNILVEILLGTIPVLGDVFDVFWKANRKNYRLLALHIGRELGSDEQRELGVTSAGDNGEEAVFEESDWTAPVLNLIALAAMAATWYFYGDAIDAYWSDLIIAVVG